MRILSKPLKKKKTLKTSKIVKRLDYYKTKKVFGNEEHDLYFAELPKNIQGLMLRGSDGKPAIIINTCIDETEAAIDEAWEYYNQLAKKAESIEQVRGSGTSQDSLKKSDFEFLFFTDERRF